LKKKRKTEVEEKTYQDDLLSPCKNVQIVDRDKLIPNNYNPNLVTEKNMELLIQSILSNGWTSPIVIRRDYTIIDGYHRWLAADRPVLKEKLKGKVPIVFVDHENESEDIYGTITHNRARGTHLLAPMKAVVKKLMDSGESIKEIGKQLGMSDEEIFRLSDFSKDEFLKMLTKGKVEYSKARFIFRI
jgi:ParB-like chromosome segregation protein Spo0J